MTGLYAHVPFCKTKCPYCDFVSIIALDEVERYLEAVEVEARLRGQGAAQVDTVYIGGGTPSAIGAESLLRLISSLSAAFEVSESAEWTVELNPDDVDDELLGVLADSPVERISLGVQTFDDEALRFLGRRHSASDACRAVELVRAHGCINLSLDVMFGWHRQTEASHRECLEMALSYDPEHLSCYQLTIEGDAPFARRLARGELSVIEEERARRLFLLTHDVLTDAGHEHYEVSNYAKPGRRSRHNQSYWRHVPYMGLGPSAHSFDGGRRRSWNLPHIEAYVARAFEAGDVTDGFEILTEEQLTLERLLLGFRTIDGVALESLEAITGWEACVETLVEDGFCRRQGDRVVATLEGLLVADSLPLRFQLP